MRKSACLIALSVLILSATPDCVFAQALNFSGRGQENNGQHGFFPWSGYARVPQHTAISATATQPLNHIHWQTPVDLNAPDGGDLFIHYGSISVTAGNTVLVPVKTGITGGFEVMAFSGKTGASLYSLTSDYSLPNSN